MVYQSSDRTGFTLFELLVAITVGSTIMMLATMMVGNAFDWTKLASQRHQDDQTIFRLATQLRRDVNTATDAAVNGPELKLTFADQSTAIYNVSASSVERVCEISDPKQAAHRESYRWKRERHIQLEIDDITQQVVLIAATPSPFAKDDSTDQSQPPLWRTIRASVGLRWKHQQGEIEP